MNTSTMPPAAAPALGPTPNPPTLGGPCEGRNDQSKEVGSSGRAISARNATTHGLFARDVVLTALGEDPAAFDALLQQLMTQLPPRHLLERHYLEQIAAASWRLRRLHRWQAQIYEDDALTEDQRLDKLDKVLRHETALTRQIDRAVRMMNRDLAWLFQNRLRDDALYFRNVTDVECRQDPDLAIQVQQLVWKEARSFSPDADLDYARLDTAPVSADPLPADESQNCQNEPPAYPSSLTPPLLGAGGPSKADASRPLPSLGGKPCEPQQIQSNALEGIDGIGHSVGIGSSDGKCTLQDLRTPEGYLAYRKREQEMHRRLDPNAARTEIDWDDPDTRKAYGAP